MDFKEKWIKGYIVIKTKRGYWIIILKKLLAIYKYIFTVGCINFTETHNVLFRVVNIKTCYLSHF